MLRWFKVLLLSVLILILAATAVVYGFLTLSLPTLDGKGTSKAVKNAVSIARDGLGQAVITAEDRADAAYGLGFAHGQDRFFQMDLLRRNAAGELSQLFGEAALELDKSMRFHQFRKRAERAVGALSDHHRDILSRYVQGVNEGRQQIGMKGYEYTLLGAEPAPWVAADSLLVIYSMYLDLQSGNFQRDQALVLLAQEFGQDMLDFLLQPSRYQAALDGSELPVYGRPVPSLPKQETAMLYDIKEQIEVGSNNWAVTAALTNTDSAMLSDDMHLGLNVPPIWYRAQLNYLQDSEQLQVTGVSLPGAPAIVVGTNSKIAWGFTNSYMDLADWVSIGVEDEVVLQSERIALPSGEYVEYSLPVSAYGPVTEIAGQRYALSWVAHQPYAVNFNLMMLENTATAATAVELASAVGIPTQNLVVVDTQGDAAWTLMGAIPNRAVLSDVAVSRYDQGWQTNLTHRPSLISPEHGRIWTANSRVVSASDNIQFGDGGYALGARALQIREGLLQKNRFKESDFYALQLDNEARFLRPWHKQLTQLLTEHGDKTVYQQDLSLLADWQACACSDSVGYTLVKRFRAALLDRIFSPVEHVLKQQNSSLSHIERYLEPAMWQLLQQQPEDWLVQDESWQALQLASYQTAKQQLSQQFGENMAAWQWGTVNQLKVQHPFSKQIPWLSHLLDMPEMPGFGDKYMPAVQAPASGASQRFIVQPGYLDQAIMTVAGGQSGHPLSPFYRAGFEAYATGETVPLLPSERMHQIIITPVN
ncbi:penicillin acylase family protein [Pseudoalteromonas sp. T1lg65]|uniref:penicillin acylase family protein n=1 Tax=Pseudoalteromonas sp. T1lg65 TaxID=2077101 RepID=UPI003F7AC3D2